MGRPKSSNPKTKYIGIVTTPEKFDRFKALGLVGDQVIDVLLYHLENDNTKLNVQKMQLINNIKKIDAEIEQLEYEKINLETKLEEINQSIGVNEQDGLRKDISRAVNKCLQRYDNVREIYTINDFIKYNKDFIANQAYLANIPMEELKELLLERA